MKSRIKEKRKTLHLTQEDMAKRLHVSRQTIISLENGRYNPSLILAHKIAQLFHCSIEEVFIFEGDENLE